MLRIAIPTLAVVVLVAPAQSEINYGDFVGNDVTFREVTETALSLGDVEPLFGFPTVSGNTLLFNNMSSASSSSGEFGVDDTVGQLTTTITADPPIGIHGLQLDEIGSATLSGDTNEAFAAVGAVYVLTILEVDGVAIDPVNRTLNMVFSPSDGDYFLSVDGILNALVWEGSLGVDVSAILDVEGIDGVATKVSLTLTNSLATASQAGTSAFIDKTQRDGLAITVIIPSPAVVGILDLLALLASWGPCPPACPPSCAADFDDDCQVGITDLLILLASWG